MNSLLTIITCVLINMFYAAQVMATACDNSDLQAYKQSAEQENARSQFILGSARTNMVWAASLPTIRKRLSGSEKQLQ